MTSNRKIIISVFIIYLGALACNLPRNVQGSPNEDENNSVDFTPTALTASEIAGACTPMVTTTTLANVRKGPGTQYNVIGSIPQGGTAPVVGKNSDGSWWYIQFSSGNGGLAWIAGIVTTSSCIPDSLAVIAGPAAPIAATISPSNPSVASEPDVSESTHPSDSPPVAEPTLPFAILPRLTAELSPDSSVDIKIEKIRNIVTEVRVYFQIDNPDGLIGNFEVKYWINGSFAGATNVPFTPGVGAWPVPYYVPPRHTAFTIHVIIDPTNAIIEYDETNNDVTKTCDGITTACN